MNAWSDDVWQQGACSCLMLDVPLSPWNALSFASSFPSYHHLSLPFHPWFAEQFSPHSASLQSLQKSCPDTQHPLLFLLSSPNSLILQLVPGDLVPFEGSNSIHGQFCSLLIPSVPSISPLPPASGNRNANHPSVQSIHCGPAFQHLRVSPKMCTD